MGRCFRVRAHGRFHPLSPALPLRSPCRRGGRSSTAPCGLGGQRVDQITVVGEYVVMGIGDDGRCAVQQVGKDTVLVGSARSVRTRRLVSRLVHQDDDDRGLFVFVKRPAVDDVPSAARDREGVEGG